LLGKIKSKIKGDIHFKEILTGSAVTFVMKIFGMFLGYLVILIISQQYGAESVGVYSLTLSMMTFFAMIAAMGMNFSILRYVGQFNKIGGECKLKLLYRYAVELVVPFSLLLALLLYFFAGTIAENVFHNPVYQPALEFAALIVPFMTLKNMSVEFIRGLKQLKVSEFLRSVNQAIISITLLSIVGLFIVDELLPLYSLGAGVVVSALFAVYFIVKKLQKIVSESKVEFSKRELVTTSFPMMVTTIASFLMGNVSLFMLEVFSTTEEVGVFSVAFKIATLISLILVAVNTISAPKFSELYWEHKYRKLQEVINHSTKLIFFNSLLLSMAIILYSKAILAVFGDEFVIGTLSLILLVVGQMINSATGSVSILLNMTGHQKVLSKIVLITTITTIFVNIILIKSYGINGAAFSFIISMALLNISAVIYVKKALGFTTFYNPFIRKTI